MLSAQENHSDVLGISHFIQSILTGSWVVTGMPANIFFAFVNLVRMRITVMVMVACAIGFILAQRNDFPLPRVFWTLIGTGLLSGGACTLNCYMEREADALMPRTCRRPIPAGIIRPSTALGFGVVLVLAGCVLLFGQINVLSGWLGLAAVLIYLAVYTPAKRLTWLNTSIGAVPGAIPPLIGWASARGEIDAGGWILFTMLFLWQHTHFLPIAWLFRSDYQKAGFQMLPVLETNARNTFRLTVITAIALLPISLLLSQLGVAGSAYCFACVLLSILLIVAAVRLSRQPSRQAAHAVLFLSLYYLPVLLATVVLDRYGVQFGNNFHDWLETLYRWT
jgi:heme o synthase